MVGFVGMRMQAQEGHITNIAVKPCFSKEELWILLRTMIEIAQKSCCSDDLKFSDNYNAQSLYRKIDLGIIYSENYYSAEHGRRKHD